MLDDTQRRKSQLVFNGLKQKPCWAPLVGLMLALSAIPVHAGETVVDMSADPSGDDPADRLERRLQDMERRLEIQALSIAQQQAVIDQQNEAIVRQGRQIQDQMVESQRLRIELAGQGQWDVIDRNRQHDGRYDPLGSAGRPRVITAGLQPDPAAPPPAAPAAADTQDAERPKSDKAVDQLLLDQGGVLLPANTLQIEPSIEYTSISSDRVNISGFSIFDAILIGSIRVDDVNRDILTGAITARYGTGHRMQVDLRVPFVYRNDTETTGIGTGDALERRISGSGLGDIGLTLAWQPLSARGWRPATILRIQAEYPTGKSAFEIERIAPEENSPERILVSAPTGSGFYTFSPGATFVWPIDPVVLFAGGSYNYSFKRRFDQFGLVEPGHGFEFFTGMNMSINERVSMNFSFLDKQRFATRLNGLKLPGSGTHDARLSLGASIGLTDRTTLVISAANGLTDESPDFTFSVRLPIIF